eukprot:symbB.v1.2.007521.t1/scaffold462.1/size201456/11
MTTIRWSHHISTSPMLIRPLKTLKETLSLRLLMSLQMRETFVYSFLLALELHRKSLWHELLLLHTIAIWLF